MLTITVTQLKTRLDKAVVEAQPEISRSRVQRDIEAGLVSVNGEVVREAKFVVRVGDAIAYDYKKVEDQAHEAKDIPLKTLYNDHGLLVIDKPPGISVHPGAGVRGDSLTQALLYHFKDIHVVGEDGRPGIVHRLDKDTSGVMLVALTQEMYEYLKDAFADRRVKKEYIALVQGKVEKMHGFIDTPIGKSKSDFRKYATKNIIEAKPSLTEYEVLEYLPVKDQGLKIKDASIDGYTLILVKLHTGRTHQIRVHMASLGHPLMGDTLYGNKHSALPDLNRQFLHARKIEVQLPEGTWIECESPLPEGLREVLKSLASTKVLTL